MSASPSTARVVEVARHGAPGALRLAERPLPEPGPGQLSVRVRAVGVNFADVMARLGLYAPAPPPPFVPGFEVAGSVAAVGPGVEGFRAGESVIAGLRFGGYATHVVAEARRVLPLPDGWSFVEGAGFLATYATAWHALVTLGRVEAGARVLVHAGAGGLGTAALQVARRLGATAVATAGGPEKARFCEAHGAHAGVDYLVSGWDERARAAAGGGGFDLVLDTVLGPTLRRSHRLLRDMGHLVVCGAASFTPRRRVSWPALALRWLARPRLDPLALIGTNTTVSGFNLLTLWEQGAYLDRLGAALRELAASGAVRPVVGATFPLERAADAHALLQGRGSRGKLVLEVA